MYGLQIGELIIVCVYACAEEEAGVAAVHDFRSIAELDKVGLVFLVAGGYEAVDLGGWSCVRTPDVYGGEKIDGLRLLV
jgi:hypothetical protein